MQMDSSSSNSTPKIKLEGVVKSFGDNHVLKGVDLEIADGESVVLIGASAAGKTCLMKCIVGLVAPDAGSIQIDGQETTRLSPKEREVLMHRMGMLFQQSALFDSQLVWQNVAFQLLQDHKLSRAEAKEIAIETLTSVGLPPDVGELLPAEISGGMQKRVGLARAIAAEPEIIFFDEPTTGLDPIMAGVINDLIREIVVEMGATAMTITHDMSSVRAIADKVAMLHNGVIQWSGPISDIDQSGDPYLDQFIHGRAEGPIEAIR